MASTRPQSRTVVREHAASRQDESVAAAQRDWQDARYQAFALMRLALTVAPIAFGLDKFFNVLVDWPKYLASWINERISRPCTL